MAPINPSVAIQFIGGPGDCDCSPQYFIPLWEWVNMAAREGQPEKVKRLALRFLNLVKKSKGRVVKDEVLVCPDGNIHATIKLEHNDRKEIGDLKKEPWPNNVLIVYEMFHRFNIYTAHMKSLLTPEDEFGYSGPLRLFNPADFECLQDVSSIVDLIWEEHRTVESTASDIRLI